MKLITILEQTFRPGKFHPIVRQIYMILFLIISIGQIYCSLLTNELGEFELINPF